jgi:hypothetical protein
MHWINKYILWQCSEVWGAYWRVQVTITKKFSHFSEVWRVTFLSNFNDALTPWNMSPSLMLRPTVSRPVCPRIKHPSGALRSRLLLLSDSCGFVDVARPLWREEVSVIYNCCWPSPAQSLSGPRQETGCQRKKLFGFLHPWSRFQASPPSDSDVCVCAKLIKWTSPCA